MYTVGELINNHISDSSVTKNNIIRLLNIDRSTFYQMLKGKRLPSAAQLGTILDTISIPPYEKKHISEVYISEKLSVSEYSNRKAIINLIDTLREGVILSDDCSESSSSKKASSYNEAMKSGLFTPSTSSESPVKSRVSGISDSTQDSLSRSTVLNNRPDIMDFIRGKLFFNDR